MSDYTDALAFAQDRGERFRYIQKTGRWMVCDDNGLWREDDRNAVQAAAQAFIEASGRDAEQPRVERLIRALRSPLAAVEEQFDADPWALVTGDRYYIDLRTLDARAVEPHDYATKTTEAELRPDDDEVACSYWNDLLEHLAPSLATRDFLRRAVGMSLAGVVREHGFVLLRGSGGNGKGTFTAAVRKALGDYATNAPRSLLMAGERHPTEQATLWGKRFATCEELKDAELNVPLLKTLSGGDPVTARRMRLDYETHPPTHTLWLTSQYFPSLGGDVSEGVWRRAYVIETGPSIARDEQDLDLPARLAEPLAQTAVLRWALRGCVDWLRYGLETSKEMDAAVETWRNEEDALGGWFADVGARWEEGAWTSNAALRLSLEQVFRRKPPSDKQVAAWLRDHRCNSQVRRSGGVTVRGWRGIRLPVTS